MDLIIYHGNCPDGWTAAYIAKRKFPNAELLGLDHGLTDARINEIITLTCGGKDVLMVDYSFRKREDMDKLNQYAKSFLVLDHHKTAEATLAGANYAVFDMKRSGAGLTWDHYYGIDSLGPYGEQYDPRPWWVNYTEDRDLWNWKLPKSREISAYMMTFPYTVEGWDQMTAVDITVAAEAGSAIELQIRKYVREAAKQAQQGRLDIRDLGLYNVAILNVPYLNCSEVGEELAKTNDVSITWFERGDGFYQFSLRSRGDIDVSKIAQFFKGGGHKNAAGFQLPYDEGRIVIDKIVGRHTVELFAYGAIPEKLTDEQRKF